ncbi:MAG: 2-amino-4-hydroxy-6-hydroxymethyldihydropteridine diphosphokinase [Intrasporangium sp.]|uniref:2-amino-4-hydroxy-6- hydroxymethyldihydropteridine diphosphokinase n=1 Tax=Intrasporangium sp. TaxID=1925024 RepID=UPI002649229B|nr:2-amino-4-hydroxy-6-hydroxymethyldihydropteridine diphosphokinase [Intrasporangium sp.]MDN5795427.1 2-amino-4-hydroxy-6-hydroxymethyldihydropteridine diphosphokinase [Intrasporangium sp.]
MTDQIVLQGVSARGFHGVLGAEKRDGQTFVVDVTLEVDLSAAGRSDDLATTVDYAKVAGEIVGRVTGPSFDLIERLATVIADDVLRRDRVEAVEVVVHKPQAPVGHPFSDVQVRLWRGGVPVVVALGSNLGDRDETLRSAVEALADRPGILVVGVSPVVETDPVGGPPDQPPFLNAVALVRTDLPPDALLATLHEIEAEHGRTREVRWGARTLDLDLIQYGSPGSAGEVRSEAPELTLPHPRAAERAFVLLPWDLADPAARLRVGDGAGGIRRVGDLLAGTDRSGVRTGPEWGDP